VNNGGTADMTAGEFVDMWQKKLERRRVRRSQLMPGSTTAAPNDDGDLSDLAAEQAAERYISNGVIPPLGQGKTATRNRDKILNLAAEIEKKTGRTGAEAVAAWAGVKANAAALPASPRRAAW
jgi:hypothetical protein